jgi:hypothetical protein
MHFGGYSSRQNTPKPQPIDEALHDLLRRSLWSRGTNLGVPEKVPTIVLPFRGLAESIIASETGFESRCISRSQRRLRMKKTSIIAAGVLLIGSSAVSYAAGPQNGSHGASGSAPGIQMQSPTNTPPAQNGASTFAPGTSAPGRHR